MTENEAISIDEAIEHSMEVANDKRADADWKWRHGRLNSDDCISCAEQHEQLAEWLEELKQYRAIGTIEEFKDLKEKSVAKKPTPIDYEKYMDVVTNAKFLRGACWCPNCKHTVLSGVCCGNCGQKLDWSE